MVLKVLPGQHYCCLHGPGQVGLPVLLRRLYKLRLVAVARRCARAVLARNVHGLALRYAAGL